MALPTYFSVGFNDVYKHFKMVSDKIKLPVLYYHFPENTKLKLKPVEIAKICNEIENIVGIKLSTFNLNEIKKIVSNINKKPFSVFSGTSLIFLDVLKIGGCGVICPIPLIIPETVIGLYNSFKSGDIKEAKRYEKKIFKLLPILSDIPVSPEIARWIIKLLSRINFPVNAGGKGIQAGFKEALRQMGFNILPLVRSPLPQIDERRKLLIKSVLKELNL